MDTGSTGSRSMPILDRCTHPRRLPLDRWSSTTSRSIDVILSSWASCRHSRRIATLTRVHTDGVPVSSEVVCQRPAVLSPVPAPPYPLLPARHQRCPTGGSPVAIVLDRERREEGRNRGEMNRGWEADRWVCVRDHEDHAYSTDWPPQRKPSSNLGHVYVVFGREDNLRQTAKSSFF
jgi:hypothetical protein